MIAGRLQMKLTKIIDEKVMYNEPCRMHSKKTAFDVALLRKLFFIHQLTQAECYLSQREKR
jgi:hypothetical protein